jgi:hypothetical protein
MLTDMHHTRYKPSMAHHLHPSYHFIISHNPLVLIELYKRTKKEYSHSDPYEVLKCVYTALRIIISLAFLFICFCLSKKNEKKRWSDCILFHSFNFFAQASSAKKVSQQ